MHRLAFAPVLRSIARSAAAVRGQPPRRCCRSCSGIRRLTPVQRRTFLVQAIADVDLVRRADRYVAAATESLLNNSRAGPGEVGRADNAFAGTDPVLIDSSGALLHKRQPADIPLLRCAAAHCLGLMETAAGELREAKLG